jgi:Sec1 family
MMANRKVVLVVFIGGVTPTEMSCLRFIAERAPIDFVVLATSVTNGSRLLQQVMGPGTEADPRYSEFAALPSSSSLGLSLGSGAGGRR